MAEIIAVGARVFVDRPLSVFSRCFKTTYEPGMTRFDNVALSFHAMVEDAKVENEVREPEGVRNLVIPLTYCAKGNLHRLRRERGRLVIQLDDARRMARLLREIMEEAEEDGIDEADPDMSIDVIIRSDKGFPQRIVNSLVFGDATTKLIAETADYDELTVFLLLGSPDWAVGMYLTTGAVDLLESLLEEVDA